LFEKPLVVLFNPNYNNLRTYLIPLDHARF